MLKIQKSDNWHTEKQWFEMSCLNAENVEISNCLIANILNDVFAKAQDMKCQIAENSKLKVQQFENSTI